jgi:hypothetical protein
MKRHLSFIAALGMCFFASNVTAHAQQIKADTGGIAISGSVTGSTINIGVPPEQLAALVRQAADLSETQKKVISRPNANAPANISNIQLLSLRAVPVAPPQRGFERGADPFQGTCG